MKLPSKLPKSVNICGHVFPIKQVRELSKNVAAEFDPVAEEIRIAVDQPIKEKWRSLLHEIRHAHQYEMGLMQVLHAQALEIDCDSFASLILSLKKQGVL